MTFSILALDPQSGAIGCAAATGNLAVGGWVLRSAADGGTVATQGASVSTLWGDDALLLLRDGVNAGTVVQTLVQKDDGRGHRQLAVLDLEGNHAVWTGEANTDAKGHVDGDSFIVSGNWLSSLDVLNAVAENFETSKTGTSTFARRLIDALQAGADAGSDSRGTMSAAVQVVSSDQPPLDLRVDYSEQPLVDLFNLYNRATSHPYTDWVSVVPTMKDPYRC